jgi:hypothetical protein
MKFDMNSYTYVILFQNHPWTKYPSSISTTKQYTDITMKDVFLPVKIRFKGETGKLNAGFAYLTNTTHHVTLFIEFGFREV